MRKVWLALPCVVAVGVCLMIGPRSVQAQAMHAVGAACAATGLCRVTLTSSVASGSKAIALSTGQRLDLGGGANDYLYSDGSQVLSAGNLVAGGSLSSTGGITATGGYIIISAQAALLGNCGVAVGQGNIQTIQGAGATKTKMCLCTYDGSAWAYVNLTTNTVGTASACN